jgi:hypothetical protein
MGHQRLGDIPKTQKWNAVVARVTTGGGGAGRPTLISDVDSVASEVIDAAEQGLEVAFNDPGLHFAFYALTQIVLAARQPNWHGAAGVVGQSNCRI